MRPEANQAIESLQKAVRLASDNGVDASRYQEEIASLSGRLNAIGQSADSGDYFHVVEGIAAAEDLVNQILGVTRNVLQAGVAFIDKSSQNLQTELSDKQRQLEELPREQENLRTPAARLVGCLGLGVLVVAPLTFLGVLLWRTGSNTWFGMGLRCIGFLLIGIAIAFSVLITVGYVHDVPRAFRRRQTAREQVETVESDLAELNTSRRPLEDALVRVMRGESI